MSSDSGILKSFHLILIKILLKKLLINQVKKF